jgi:hypothetical protein
MDALLESTGLHHGSGNGSEEQQLRRGIRRQTIVEMTFLVTSLLAAFLLPV